MSRPTRLALWACGIVILLLLILALFGYLTGAWDEQVVGLLDREVRI